ncbi:hypothetical protein [Spongiactinospora gelatinilytica]|uniref:hypothetical protein n=1 Tax=Spongiactinospora gelatinilytica TaxID=2666298 RepID=UPI001313FBD2|nr:hypothetical protein [Spongiactinospora gelatinilytica]
MARAEIVLVTARSLVPALRDRLHLRHRWQAIETIGRVLTQRCVKCGKTRVRIR